MPVLAAIQGGCIGGGVDMVTACDMRYASADAFFCIQEINIGITADVGTLQRLPKIIPAGIARELAYTGRRLPARRAREIGLVNEVYPTQEAMLAGAIEARPILDAYIDQQLAAYGLSENKLALIGFSQGTMMSLFTAPRRETAIAGIIGGGVTVLVWKQLDGGLFDLYEIVPGFVVSVWLITFFSLIDKQPDAAVLKQFATAKE